MVGNLQNVHSRAIYSCSLNSTKSILATTGSDNAITILDVSKVKEHTMEVKFQMKNAHKSDINCIRFNPLENSLLTCGDDKAVKLWKLV